MGVPDREMRINLTAKGKNLKVELGEKGKDFKSAVKLANLSRTGMFLQTNGNFKMGREMDFSIPSQSGHAIKGRIHVCWVRKDGQGPYLPKGIGVKVLEFYEETGAEWLKFLENNLSDIGISDLLTRKMVVVDKAVSTVKVIHELRKSSQSIAVVVDDDRRPIGIFSETEILENIEDNSFFTNPVAKYMKSNPYCLSIDESLARVFQVLKDEGLDFLPITEHESLVGLITIHSVVPYWSETAIIREQRLQRNLRSALDLIVHDLRNPVGVISTTNQLLLSNFMTPEEYIKENIPEIIDHNCNVMISLIDDLLALSERGDTTGRFAKQKVDLSDLTASTFKQFQCQATKKSLKYDLAHPRDPLFVSGDPRRLEQILSNIISNALKYSRPDDSVKVSLITDGKFGIIEIADTGQGIPLEEQPFVFDEYCKISSEPTAGESSTGLGMAITKRLVEAHGGKITLDSTPGKGTTFTVLLPLIYRSDSVSDH